jgi:flagellar hook-basal body protein
VNEYGHYLLGQKLTPDETVPAPPPEEKLRAIATSNLTFEGTLNVDADITDVELVHDALTLANTPSDENLQYVTKVYDLSGQEHDLTLICGKVSDAGDKDWAVSIAPSEDYEFKFIDIEDDKTQTLVPYREGTAIPFAFGGNGKIDLSDGVPFLRLTWGEGEESIVTLNVDDVLSGGAFENLKATADGRAERIIKQKELDQGPGKDSTISPPTLDKFENVRIDTEAVATSKLKFKGALDRNASMESAELVYDFAEERNIVTDLNLQYKTKVYDLLGQEHDLTLICGKVGDAEDKDWAISIAPSEDYSSRFINIASDKTQTLVPYRNGTAIPFAFGENDKIDLSDSLSLLKITWGEDKESVLALDTRDVFLSDVFENLAVTANGHTQRNLSEWNLSREGIVEFTYSDNAIEQAYKLSLVTCANPEALTEGSGGIYFVNEDSGEFQFYDSQEYGLGTILSGTLESSTVDVAQELSDAIVTQHVYAANGKVLSTISSMLEVLERL